MDNEILPEQVERSLEDYKNSQIASSHLELEQLIDDLPKKALHRLILMYTGCGLAREIGNLPPLEYHSQEQKVMEKALRLQDDCLGYLKLKQELLTGDVNGQTEV